MRRNTPRRRLVGVIASVGLALVALSARDAVPVVVPTPRIDTPPVAEAPHPSNEFLSNIRFTDSLLKAVRGGERLAVVRFARDRLPDRPALETRIVTLPSGGVAFLEFLTVRGTFDEVRALRDGFKLGWADEEVPVSSMWGGDSAHRRLYILSRALLTEPLVLLAVSEKRSDAILDARLLGPLEVRETPLLVEWFEQAKGSATAGKRQAEKWLRSPNPWLVWLGLHRLGELKALTAAHFGDLIERRPVAETVALFGEMVFQPTATATDAGRSALHSVLEKVFRLPEKQVVALRLAAGEYRINAVDWKNRTDVPRLLAWLKSYRERWRHKKGRATCFGNSTSWFWY